MAHDALGAHARDELGITETLIARPIQAALASAASFLVGAVVPLLTAFLAADPYMITLVAGLVPRLFGATWRPRCLCGRRADIYRGGASAVLGGAGDGGYGKRRRAGRWRRVTRQIGLN